MQLLKSSWRGVPSPVRKPVVFILGVGLIVLGAVLVVVPGPFTLPPVLAGLAVLSTEFSWAHRIYHLALRQAQRSRELILRRWRRWRSR